MKRLQNGLSKIQGTYSSTNNNNQLILIAPILIENENDKFSILCQGNEGDIISTFNVYIK